MRSHLTRVRAGPVRQGGSQLRDAGKQRRSKQETEKGSLINTNEHLINKQEKVTEKRINFMIIKVKHDRNNLVFLNFMRLKIQLS